MNGSINNILENFYQGQNRITPNSIWSNTIEEARANLQSSNKIHYLLGYPQGGVPTFYILCETGKLMEHTKDWLNCALPRFYAQYARPCKKPEFDFEASLLKHSEHGFLKVPIWNQKSTEFPTDKYKDFVRMGVRECIASLDSMIQRFNESPNLRHESDKPVGMLINEFIQAYKDKKIEQLSSLYDEIDAREDIDRRNKETLKFMRLEKEKKWEEIIQLAHERNVAAQVISSGVVAAILNALVFTSCENSKALISFEINWPKLNESAQDFISLIVKSPKFEQEIDWQLWGIVAHAINVSGISKVLSCQVGEEWLDALILQDTNINAVKLKINEPLDPNSYNYDEPSITFILNYAQTCHESETIKLYEWVEAAPLPIKIKLKSQTAIYRMWQSLEACATAYFQKISG
ncbi:hypothetical protein QWY77_06090 [Thalassotalea ponticola]|uniref:hypothetical protein n=1 Tax=Thalassotalea ponticola TaxID=1523392 RepID=UPI0025B5AE34|nr:hypothetical protein [Thalassotalea ponticola]MDN3652330.1 hypothetical protein [Thalassotalea ponticola]